MKAEKLLAWLIGSDTGSSSRAIAAHMAKIDTENEFYFSSPLDPADLGRCLRLLNLFPEWKPRIAEMAQYGPEWAALVARWDELEQLMIAEVGVGWEKGGRAEKTYRLMMAIHRGARVEGRGS